MDIKENEQLNIVPEKPDFSEELLQIIKSDCKNSEIREQLSEYHDYDIATVIPLLDTDERKKLYRILGDEAVSDIFAYLEDVEEYITELDNEKAADIIEEMDADDAIDVLDELPEDKKQDIITLIEPEAQADIKLIDSYEDDMIGSRMTTNFISVKKSFSIKQAMRSLVKQAADNDNISTIYAVDDDDTFYGAIELRDLVLAREGTPLEDIITTNYPYVYALETTAECIEQLKDYSEDSIPVLNKNNVLIGVITASDIVEAVDEELGDDYAKLAGLTSEEDLDEPVLKSITKRIPWLIVLLVLGVGIAAVIQGFQTLIPASLIILYTFQSLILGMSGNAGTQSLAVTIRVLSDDELTAKDKFKFIFKELRVGFMNGLIVGTLAFAVIGVYVQFFEPTFVAEFGVSGFAVSACIGISLLISMIIASLDGTLIPIFFKKIGIDPAVASGPLITTINDLVAVMVYYGVSILMLVNILGII
ncbi:MAG: magnesium transporter [Clostridiales bacterium]|nr:magnesium transporter [Clostridiales bacterium]